MWILSWAQGFHHLCLNYTAQKSANVHPTTGQAAKLSLAVCSEKKRGELGFGCTADNLGNAASLVSLSLIPCGDGETLRANGGRQGMFAHCG